MSADRIMQRGCWGEREYRHPNQLPGRVLLPEKVNEIATKCRTTEEMLWSRVMRDGRVLNEKSSGVLAEEDAVKIPSKMSFWRSHGLTRSMQDRCGNGLPQERQNTLVQELTVWIVGFRLNLWSEMKKKPKLQRCLVNVVHTTQTFKIAIWG